MSADIIDYALPLIKMEAMIRQIHDECLNKNYAKAIELCPLLAVESRVLSASLKVMQEEVSE